MECQIELEIFLRTAWHGKTHVLLRLFEAASFASSHAASRVATLANAL